MDILRQFIRRLIETEKKKDGKKSLLTEPDEIEGREESEVSAGGVVGVTTPLGTGPTYPNRPKKKRKKKTQ